jgi:hypothetical protein
VRKLSGLANIVVRTMSAFKEAQIEQLVSSGWSTCDRVAGLVQERGLPAISRDYLAGTFSSTEWLRAEEAVGALTEQFSSARFAEEVQYGVLLVPAADSLDTRRGDSGRRTG